MDEAALRIFVSGLETSRSALHWWLEFWTILVVAGVALEVVFVVWEYVEELHDFKRGIIHPPEKPNRLLFSLGLLGAALVATGVAGELYAAAKIETLETRIRKANNDLYLLLSKEAGDAAKSSGIAHDEADKAQIASSNAQTLARGARQEADSFEADIKTAKQQAADAESHLADALQRAAKAETELNQLTTPRSLIHRNELVAALKPFRGTEYTLNVFVDDESVQFTKAIGRTLETAGWVRKQPPGMTLGVPTLLVDFGQGVTENVPTCIGTGISLSAHARESVAVLQSLPPESWPKTIQAAIALHSALGPSISPLNEHSLTDGIVDPKPGEGLPITICVGKNHEADGLPNAIAVVQSAESQAVGARPHTS